MYQAQKAQVRVAQNAFSYGKMDKSKPYQHRRGIRRTVRPEMSVCATGDVGTKGTASQTAEKLVFCISRPSPLATHGG
jgi:hypothetical protein